MQIQVHRLESAWKEERKSCRSTFSSERFVIIKRLSRLGNLLHHRTKSDSKHSQRKSSHKIWPKVPKFKRRSADVIFSQDSQNMVLLIIFFSQESQNVWKEKNGRTAETFVWKICCIILWNVISEILNLFHINHKIFDRHLCCKGFSVCWKYNFTRRKWFLGMFYSTNTDLRLPSIWDYHICAC